jgi:EpsI family protein
MARLTGVLVVEQFAFVALLISAVVALVGWQVSKFLAFPLFFLFFAVPMGEDLVPVMMEFTATFTVGALKLTGIPVYRDGLWFSLPTGDWSVVEACSGVRYLIASATLGVMYAYITYQTTWKRLLFIALSFAVPVLANGLRAYMIVIIGHLSEMKLATGVDHIFYGWVFFGIVMFLLFWVGGFWQEEPDPPSAAIPPRKSRSRKAAKASTLGVALAAVFIAGGVSWAVGKAELTAVAESGQVDLPQQLGSWKRSGQPSSWPSVHPPGAQTASARYEFDGDLVQVFVAVFPRQSQGYEAISGANRIADSATLVRQLSLEPSRVVMPSGQFPVKQSAVTLNLEGDFQQHLVWQWFRVAGHSVSNRYLGKVYEALARIYPGRADGIWIAVSTPFNDETAKVDADAMVLSSFTSVAVPMLYEAVDQSLGLGD